MTTYLNVPFRDKTEAKAKGARWDSEAKKWFGFCRNSVMSPSFVCSEPALLAGFLINVCLAARLGLITLLRQNPTKSVSPRMRLSERLPSCGASPQTLLVTRIAATESLT